MKRIELFPVLLVFLLLSLPARAEDSTGLNPNKDQPLDITADQTLEWHRNEMQYIARGHVVATQGTANIKSDTLTADYHPTEKSANDIYRLTAIGHVVITSEDHQASGDKAVYNVDQGIAIMTGDALTMTAPDQIVTARDRFEYDTEQSRLRAIGNAKAIKTRDDGTKDIITADELDATFPPDKTTNQRQLEKVTGHGHVVITTPTDILHGDEGVYDALTHIATVTGNVKLQRGPNTLEGDKAQINLITNVSQMIATPGQSRVHGIFYPGSDKPGGNIVPAPAAALDSIKSALPTTITVKPTTPSPAATPAKNTADVMPLPAAVNPALPASAPAKSAVPTPAPLLGPAAGSISSPP